MITLENVSKSYSTGAPALNGISLHIDEGAQRRRRHRC